MSESLVPSQSASPVSREEMLTRQFYDWEMRGRGWDVRSFPVELEPPFRPIIFYDSVPDAITDDARVPSFFSKLFEKNGGKQQPPKGPSEAEYLERIAELDEPAVCGYYEEDFYELQIILPKDQKETARSSESTSNRMVRDSLSANASRWSPLRMTKMTIRCQA